MAPHSSTLAWKIPWTQEPGGLQSMGLLRVVTFPFPFHALEKEMATHSSVLAWRIPGTGEPGGLPSMGSHSRTRLKRLSSSSRSKACNPRSGEICSPLSVWLAQGSSKGQRPDPCPQLVTATCCLSRPSTWTTWAGLDFNFLVVCTLFDGSELFPPL